MQPTSLKTKAFWTLNFSRSPFKYAMRFPIEILNFISTFATCGWLYNYSTGYKNIHQTNKNSKNVLVSPAGLFTNVLLEWSDLIVDYQPERSYGDGFPNLLKERTELNLEEIAGIFIHAAQFVRFVCLFKIFKLKRCYLLTNIGH